MSSTIGPSLPPQPSSLSYNPLGKPAVGLESPEAKNQTLPPVEESARTEKDRNQLNKKGDELATDADRRKQRERDAAPGELTDEELKNVRELASVDREVRAHEAAHSAVGGNLAGGPSFRFITGPDGPQYAVGGEVPIALEVVPDDPSATLRNAQQVQAAALAPAKPSTQDIQVAAAAAQLIIESQLQLAVQLASTANISGADKPGSAAEATSAFKSADTGSAPGSLLDQRV